MPRGQRPVVGYGAAGATGGAGARRSLVPGLLAEQLLDLLFVVLGKDHGPVKPARALGRLVLEQVVAVGAAAHDLAGAGHLEPFLGTAVRLVLRHGRRRLPSPRRLCPGTRVSPVGRTRARQGAICMLFSRDDPATVSR